MEVLLPIVSFVLGYLIGSINVSVIVSKVAYKSDVRKYGSGNAGATNMARVFGLLAGMIVLIGDFGKCILSMWLASLIGGENCSLAAGLGCLIGHAFPLYFKFKGGKGVTVGAALALMLDWRAFVAILVVFVIMFLITRTVSVSSIVAAASLIIVLVGIYTLQGSLKLVTLYELIAGTLAAIFVIALHHENIKRILNGTEKKFTYKKRDR